MDRSSVAWKSAGNFNSSYKRIPRLLQNGQKEHRLEVCRELHQQLQEDPNFLSLVVTGCIRLLSLSQDENQVERAKI
jgi:hypothetical protein